MQSPTTPTAPLPIEAENEEIAAELRYLAGIAAVTDDDVTSAAEIGDALDRDLAIKLIRHNLKQRSGKTWSVTGGRGSAWGWITITAPPARRVDNELTPEDARELGDLLGLPEKTVYRDLMPAGTSNAAHSQGVDIADDREWYLHYIDASAGVESAHGTPRYWD